MNQEDIKLVLSYCKVDTKYFEVSKVFEAIYICQTYTLEVVDRLFRIACYRGQNLEQLINRNLINKDHYTKRCLYWNSIPCHDSLSIDWELFEEMNLDCCDLLVNISTPYSEDIHYYEDSCISKEDAQFGFEFIEYFKYIQNKFVKLEDENRWMHQSYEVRYTSDCSESIDINEFVALIDYKRRRYLIIGSIDSHVSISCNTFELGTSNGSYSSLLIYECKDTTDIKLKFVLQMVKSYYSYCVRLFSESSN